MNRWKGLGIVIGQGGRIVLIRHGSNYIRVSPGQALQFGKEFIKNTEDETRRKSSQMPSTASQGSYKLFDTKFPIFP